MDAYTIVWFSENRKKYFFQKSKKRWNSGNFKHFLRHEFFCHMPLGGHTCKKHWSSSPQAENVSVNRDPLLTCDKKFHGAKSAWNYPNSNATYWASLIFEKFDFFDFLRITLTGMHCRYAMHMIATVYWPLYRKEYKTEYTTTYKQECHIVHEPHYETKCDTTYEKECSTSYETTYHKSCSTSYERVSNYCDGNILQL